MDSTGRLKLGMLQQSAAGAPPPPPGIDAGQRFAVRTPSAAFKGTRAGCQFCDGVAYTDDEAQASECRALGYTVEDRKPPPPAPPAKR